MLLERQDREGDVSALTHQVLAVRRRVLEDAQDIARASEVVLDDGLGDDDRARLHNLYHYLALRRQDIRPLQRQLMCRGLSSLGRLESRVMPTLDAVLCALAAIDGRPAPFPSPAEHEFFRGESMLAVATETLLGPGRAHRRGRIMVTLPGDAAERPEFILALARSGMDVARINCAHDDKTTWEDMAKHVRAAGTALGRHIAILMDIAGPKIRTGQVLSPASTKIQVGDRIRLCSGALPRVDDTAPFSAAVSVPEIVTRLKLGDRVRYDDGKLEGVVDNISSQEAVIRVTRTKTNGSKLKPEKGLNLPDTVLGLSPLTMKDHADLAVVIEHADMLGYSFVSRPDDLDLLEDVLATLPPRARPLGVVAKIEQPEALENLPALIAAAFRHRRPFGVMIARGDLAAEVGFERLAEMQEEILWLCEAASMPAIWATQVLEDLVKTGIPTRGEMTDAAMAARAECVMLNKGEAIIEAVAVLDRLMSRMDEHFTKKTPTLRALRSWTHPPDPR